jgi:hypothetical protein
MFVRLETPSRIGVSGQAALNKAKKPVNIFYQIRP